VKPSPSGSSGIEIEGALSKFVEHLVAMAEDDHVGCDVRVDMRGLVHDLDSVSLQLHKETRGQWQIRVSVVVTQYGENGCKPPQPYEHLGRPYVAGVQDRVDTLEVGRDAFIEVAVRIGDHARQHAYSMALREEAGDLPASFKAPVDVRLVPLVKQVCCRQGQEAHGNDEQQWDEVYN
jgi:hypothetical protein